MGTATDSELIARACLGEQVALGELYTRYTGVIYRYVYYRTGDDALAQDLTAEVFLRVVEGIALYDQRHVPFSAWLYSIARARLVDYWRRTGRRRTLSLEDTGVETLADDNDVLEKALSDHRLSQLLQKLTTDQQEVVILRFVEGLSSVEVAQVMGKSEGAVKALQHRALRRLAGELAAP